MNDLAIAALLLLLPSPPAAARSDSAEVLGERSESARLYQEGIDSYAAGDHVAALASFREVLRREPGNRSAIAAVRRLEGEAQKPRLALLPPPDPPSEGFLERFALVTAPRWLHFERTLGDALSRVGTLDAMNGRVVQLLGERKIALAQNRPFKNERRLRELLRRASVEAKGFEEA